MVDGQDRFEWVNVSSGTGSPGLSWTKGHKTVVVHCMYIMCMILASVCLCICVSYR